MDSDRFDALTRSFSADTTRRSLTRLLGGLALSGLLSSLAGAAKKGGHHNKGGHYKNDGNAKKGGKGKGNGKKGTKSNDGHKQDNDKTVSASATGGCGRPSDPCSRNNQCCSDKCSRLSGTCLCTAASQCPPLDPPNPCATRICYNGNCDVTLAAEGTVCNDGQVCKIGQCVTPRPSCSNDTECTGGRVCVNRECRCDPDGHSCGGDCLCERTGWVCEGGQCVCSPNYCGNGCSCPADRVCRDSRCVCDGTHCRNGCTCFADKVCQDDGQCVFPSCVDDADCPDASGLVCVNGVCTCDSSRGCGKGCQCPSDWDHLLVCQNGQCVCNRERCDHGCSCAADQVCWDPRYNSGIQYCICDPKVSCGDNCACAGGPDDPGLCEGGTCVYRPCVEAADCADGQVCQNGQCLSTTTRSCWGDIDCPGGQYCHLYCSDPDCDMVTYGECE